MDERLLEHCVQELQMRIVSNVITWAIVLAILAGVLLLFLALKPLKRFLSKAKKVIPIIMAAMLILALVDIVPKIIDLQKQSFVVVEDAVIERIVTYTMPFNSHYIEVTPMSGGQTVLLEHSALIPFSEDPDTTYRGTVVYGQNSSTLVYVRAAVSDS